MPVSGRKSAGRPKAVALEGQANVIVDEEVSLEIEEMKETKIVLRTVSANPNPAAGAFSAGAVDAYITGLLAEGWRILNTHFVGTAPEGFFFAWILVR